MFDAYLTQWISKDRYEDLKKLHLNATIDFSLRSK